MKKNIVFSLIFLMLSILSTFHVYRLVIRPNTGFHINFSKNVLNKEVHPPYRYRVLRPIIGENIKNAILNLNPPFSESSWHLLVYTSLLLAVIFTTNIFFYKYLTIFFDKNISLIGVAMLHLFIPLSLTGSLEGDFYTLMFYSIGLYCIFSKKDHFIPIIIGVGAMNRVQVVFIVVIYIVHLLRAGKIKRNMPYVIASLIVYASVIYSIRHIFGFQENTYTFAVHIENNTHIGRWKCIIGPLYFAQFFGLFLLVIYKFKSGTKYLTDIALLVPLYFSLFFLKGNLWELAKALPAYFMLIPIALDKIKKCENLN